MTFRRGRIYFVEHQSITRIGRLALVRSLLIAFPARETLGLSDEMETYESHGLHPQ
jgi:hypothetical protein